jgi:hypothetical protein
LTAGFAEIAVAWLAVLAAMEEFVGLETHGKACGISYIFTDSSQKMNCHVF